MLTQSISQLLPNYCVMCQQASDSKTVLCRFCQKHLPKPSGLQCPRCALQITINHGYCGRCLHHPPAFDQTFCPLVYTTPINHFVYGLKFNQQLQYARLFGKLFAEFIQQQKLPLPQAIIAVPLHKQRLRQRGFNQALEIAKVIAHNHKLPLLKNHLIRTKATQAQATLKAATRHKNLQQAFEQVGTSKHSHLALVDDVMTTGATLHQCAATLKKHGVKRVDAWCIARTQAG